MGFDEVEGAGHDDVCIGPLVKDGVLVPFEFLPVCERWLDVLMQLLLG